MTAAAEAGATSIGGIAGIMGGQVSEVSERTTRVLLEVANWNGTNILRTSRKLGLRTDASNRFEKQLHPELAAAVSNAGGLGSLPAAMLTPEALRDELADRQRAVFHFNQVHA